MKLILQAIKALFRKMELLILKNIDNVNKNIDDVNKSIPKTAEDIGALPDTVTNLPNPKALTFTGGVTGSYDGSTVKTVNIPIVPTAIKNPKALTFTGGVTGSYDGSTVKTVNIPTALKNPNALTFTGSASGSYDGSSAMNAAIPFGFPTETTRNNLLYVLAVNQSTSTDETLLALIKSLGIKHGIVEETDGELYYYVVGKKHYAGLFYQDGYYYYADTYGKIKRNTTYWVTKNNGLLPSKQYSFDEYGRITDLPDIDTREDGIYSESGKLYYFNRTGENRGLCVIDGDYYFIKSSDNTILCSGTYIANLLNGLVLGEDVRISADAHGRIQTPLYRLTPIVSNCSIEDNRPHNVFEGTNLTLTPVAKDGYSISAVTVKMGDEDITATAYADGVITIESVAGDIIITATAEATT